MEEDPTNKRKRDDTPAAKPEGDQQDDGVRKKSKKYHRVAPHQNPMASTTWPYPASPSAIDWTHFYPSMGSTDSPPSVSMADIGCGYGGLLVGLSQVFPDKCVLGQEIRSSVVNYVAQRIAGLRRGKETESGAYSNASVVRANTMKFFPNYFSKGQLDKLFFLFPDPHWKKALHRRRIISPSLLSDYAYGLAIGGKLYTVSDVPELAAWMQKHCTDHPLFERVPDEENETDPVIPLLLHATEEAQKVDREGRGKDLAVFRRIQDPAFPQKDPKELSLMERAQAAINAPSSTS